MDLTAVKLEKKGDSSEITPFSQMIVKIVWPEKIDFDLACFIEEKNIGDQEQMPTFLYFAKTAKGNLHQFPYMMMGDDDGADDSVAEGGMNEEELTIMRFDPRIAKIHIIAWDYTMVEQSSPARFNESQIRTECTDDSGKVYNVTLTAGDFANACVMATIDCTGSTPHLINRSTKAVLKGFENLQQMYDLCHKD